MRLDSNAVLADDPLLTSVTHTSELIPMYEDILPPEKQKWNFKETLRMDQYLQHLSANNCHFKYPTSIIT